MFFVLPAAVTLLASSAFAAPPAAHAPPDPVSISLDTLYDAIVEGKPEAREKLINEARSRMPQGQSEDPIGKAYQDAIRQIQRGCLPDAKNPNRCAPPNDPIYPATASYQQSLTQQLVDKRAKVQLECKDLKSAECRQKRAELELATRTVNAIIDFQHPPKDSKEDLATRRKKLMRKIANVLVDLASEHGSK